MREKERFEAPNVAKQRSPDVVWLGDTPNSRAHISPLGNIPGLWGGCSSGDQGFRLVSALWTPNIPLLQAEVLACPLFGALGIILMQIPKGSLKILGVEKSGCHLRSLLTSPSPHCSS